MAKKPQPAPVILDIDLNKVFSNMDYACKVGKDAERAKWLPLWEAIKEFDKYFDFNTPLDSSNGFEDTRGANQARLKIISAMSKLRDVGEK